jgi:hypothetical protein
VAILLLGFTVTRYVFEDFRYDRTVRIRNIRISLGEGGGGHTPSLGLIFIDVITSLVSME